jgi:hypothetical protein
MDAQADQPPGKVPSGRRSLEKAAVQALQALV